MITLLIQGNGAEKITKSYCSRSRHTLTVWRRKNVIQVFAGFFCEAKLQLSLRKLLFTGLPVNSNAISRKTFHFPCITLRFLQKYAILQQSVIREKMHPYKSVTVIYPMRRPFSASTYSSASGQTLLFFVFFCLFPDCAQSPYSKKSEKQGTHCAVLSDEKENLL